MVQPATVAHAGAGSAETLTKEKREKILAPLSPINKVAKAHLIDTVDVVSANILDATLTGHCDQDELAVILWILNGVHPSMKICDLRCDNAGEMIDSMKRAAYRKQEEDPAAWKFRISKVGTLLGDHRVSGLLKYALELGFDPDWLVVKKKKKDRVSKRMATMMENAVKATIGETDNDESSVS